MQIELIGCTGVGKSTLVNKMLHSCREKGFVASTGDQFVLKQVMLDWIKNYFIRAVLVDIFTLSVCMFTLKSNLKFYRLVIEVVHQLPSTVTWFEKLNIIRNALKKLGAVEIIRHMNTNDQIVILDEGIIHTAHYLFVQPQATPPMEHLANFLQLIPLPDVVIYLQEDETILVERTLARKHRRIHNHPHNSVKEFIKNAIDTFNRIKHDPAVNERLILINGDGDIKTAANQKNSSIHMTIELIRNTFANAENSIKEEKYA